MSKLERQAELLKLARFLDVPVKRLDMLEEAPPADIRSLREAATRHFFASDAAFFRRIVSASRLLPVPLLATVAEKVLGPMLCARVAGQMDVDRGVGIAKRLETGFLAKVCLSLDPLHTRDLVRAMPVDTIREVARTLSGQEEYVTMARFVDILPVDTIRAVLDVIDDNRALLHIAFFVENKPRLDNIIELLPESRLVTLIECAAGEDALWPEALGLMEHLSPEWRGRLGDLAASLDAAVLTSMVRAVKAQALWSVALPLVADMQPESQQRFARLDAVTAPDMLLDIVRAADAEGLWPVMLPLLQYMDEAGCKRAAEASDHLDGEQLLHVADAAHNSGTWSSVIVLLAHMPEARRAEVINLIGMAPERVLKNLPAAIDSSEHWDWLPTLWPTLGSNARQRLEKVIDAAGFGDRLPART